MTRQISRDSQTNLILLVVVIILSLMAWFKPGLHHTVQHYFSSLNPDDVNTIIIDREGIGQIKLIKQENGWFLQEPYSLPANPLRVKTITALARKKSYSRFEINENELSRYQLDKPPISIWLNESKFVLGSADPIKQQRYAMNIGDNLQTGQNTVHLLSGTVFYQLRANLDTFISPMLLPPGASLKKIVWNNQSLILDNGKWQLSTDKTDISSDSVAQLLQFWKQAQASKVETNVSLNLANAELVKIKTIRIQLDTVDNITRAIDYLIVQDGEQIKLVRTDLKLAYWITPQTLKLLTEFIPIAET